MRAAITDLICIARIAFSRHPSIRSGLYGCGSETNSCRRSMPMKGWSGANLFSPYQKRQRRLTGLTSRRGPGRWHVRVQAPASVTPAAVRSGRVYVHRGGRRAAVSPAPRGPRGLEAACWADRRHWRALQSFCEHGGRLPGRARN